MIQPDLAIQNMKILKKNQHPSLFLATILELIKIESGNYLVGHFIQLQNYWDFLFSPFKNIVRLVHLFVTRQQEIVQKNSPQKQTASKLLKTVSKSDEIFSKINRQLFCSEIWQIIFPKKNRDFSIEYSFKENLFLKAHNFAKLHDPQKTQCFA